MTTEWRPNTADVAEGLAMPPRRETRLTAQRLREAFGSAAFRGSSAVALGLTTRQLEQAARSGAIVRIRRGLYSVSDARAEGHLGVLEATAHRLRCHGTEPIVFGRSAARLWGMEDVAPIRQGGPIATMAVPSAATHHAGSRAGVLIRKVDIPPGHAWQRPDGLVVTTPLRTGVDLAHGLRRAPAGALAALCLAVRCDVEQALGSSDARRVARSLEDAEITRQRIAELRQILAEARLRGGRPLSTIVELASAAPENAFEALSWAAIALSDLPRPECQRWVQGASGRWYRVDFLWQEVGLIGEADGAVKYSSAADVLAEKRRQADLEAAGYRFVRWLWEDVVPDPLPMLVRVGRALSRRPHSAPPRIRAANRQLRSR